MSTVWRVAIADDEPLARTRIRTLLARHPQFAVAAECAHGKTVLTALESQALDVLFLDIRMPQLDGLGVAEAVRAMVAPPAIVFVTAYDEHAVRAFDVDAADYLLKPVDIDRFDRTIARLTELLAHRGARVAPPAEAPASHVGFPTRFAVRDAKGSYFVNVSAIERVEAEGNYVALVVEGRRHLFRDTMQRMEAKLDPQTFIRVHRSAIVRIDQIKRLQPWGHGEYLIALADGTRITSSRNWSQGLRNLLK